MEKVRLANMPEPYWKWWSSELSLTIACFVSLSVGDPFHLCSLYGEGRDS